MTLAIITIFLAVLAIGLAVYLLIKMIRDGRKFDQTIKDLESGITDQQELEALLTCSEKGCNEPIYNFGICFKHYCIGEARVEQ